MNSFTALSRIHMVIYLEKLEWHQLCSVQINLFLVERRLHGCFAQFDPKGVENGSSCDGLKCSFVVKGPIASSHDAQQKTTPTTISFDTCKYCRYWDWISRDDLRGIQLLEEKVDKQNVLEKCQCPSKYWISAWPSTECWEDPTVNRLNRSRSTTLKMIWLNMGCWYFD